MTASRSLAVALAIVGAVASTAQEEPERPAVLVLDTGDTNGALNLGGNNQLVVRKGNIVVNSSHTHALFNANSTIEVEDGEILVVGGARNLGEATTTPEPMGGAEAVADPLAAIQYPQVTETRSQQRQFIPANSQVTLSPGYYYGGILSGGEGTTITMSPGMYVFVNGDFHVRAATVQGDGVTIIMSGQRPGRLSLGQGATVRLSAPTEGPLKDLLVAHAGVILGVKSDVSLSGCTAHLQGTIYAPRGRVGMYSLAEVTAGRVVACSLLLNTGAKLDVKGVPVDDPSWEAEEEDAEG